jgi:transposase
MTRRHQHYPPELRERAVRMVFEVTPNYDSQWAAINAVAQKLGVGTRRRCASGSARPRSTPVSGPAAAARNRRSSSGCVGRTPSCGGPTKS